MSRRWTRRSARTTTDSVAQGATEATDMQKARRLPMFGPGIPIKIPLHLLPAYMELYGLDLVEGRRAPVGPPPVLLVRRTASLVKRTGEQEKTA